MHAREAAIHKVAADTLCKQTSYQGLVNWLHDLLPHPHSQVCSQWLACGVSGDVGDLSRVQQLLVTSLQRIQRGGGAQAEGGGANGSRDTQFGEAVATLESLAVLRAWAEVRVPRRCQDCH